MRSAYEILGVDPGADAAAIKAAYRRLAKALHPDATSTNKGDKSKAEARFQEVTAAYNQLKDETSRRQYDEEQRAAQMSSFSSGFTPHSARHQDARDHLFTDLFEGLKGAGQRVFRGRGDDVAYTLSVPFLDAAKGGKIRLQLRNGKHVDVAVPAAMEDGQQLRLRGKGGDGFGGAEAGDALITLKMALHDWFRRRDLDILLDLPVTLTEAILGARVEVPTISGPVTLTIPAGSNSGTKLRLKGRGLKRPTDGRQGDQYVTLIITLPDQPDEALKDFVSGWQAGQTDNPRKGFSET